MSEEKKSLVEKMEAKTEELKEKNKNKKKATRKQKIVAAVIIPVSAVLVATAIASPNNNHRETAPDKPVDTSYHATAEKKGDVKFNGDSPSVDKAIDEIGRMSENADMTPTEKVDKIRSLAKGVTLSNQLLEQYSGSLVMVVRDGRMLENDRTEHGKLLEIFRAAVVGYKMHGTYTGDFADDYLQIVTALYRNTDTPDSDFIQENMNQLEKNINNVEY